MNVWYKIMRSRNQGKFWSYLAGYETRSFNTIRELFEDEVKNHPSDWLRIVKCEESTVQEHLGNKKRTNKNK